MGLGLGWGFRPKEWSTAAWYCNDSAYYITKPVGHTIGNYINRCVRRIYTDTFLRKSEEWLLLGIIEGNGLKSSKYNWIWLTRSGNSVHLKVYYIMIMGLSGAIKKGSLTVGDNHRVFSLDGFLCNCSCQVDSQKNRASLRLAAIMWDIWSF